MTVEQLRKKIYEVFEENPNYRNLMGRGVGKIINTLRGLRGRDTFREALPIMKTKERVTFGQQELLVLKTGEDFTDWKFPFKIYEGQDIELLQSWTVTSRNLKVVILPTYLEKTQLQTIDLSNFSLFTIKTSTTLSGVYDQIAIHNDVDQNIKNILFKS